MNGRHTPAQKNGKAQGNRWFGNLLADRANFAVDFVNTLIGRYVAVILGSLRTIFVPALLGPSLYGIWRLLALVDSLSRFSHLGTVSALTRQVPFAEGAGEPEKAHQARSTALTTSLVGGLLTSGGLLVASLVIQDPTLRLPLALFAVLNFLNRFVLFYRTLFGAERLFGSRARIRFITAFLSSTLAVGCVYLFALNGLIVATIFIVLIEIHLFRRRYGQRVALEFDRREFRSSIAIGVPILLTGVLGLVLRNIDMLMISAMIGVHGVGLFGLGSSLAQRLTDLADMIGLVAMPRLAERYGRETRIEALADLVERPATYVGLIFPAFALLVYYGSELLLQSVWQDFVGGRSALRILVLSTMGVAIYWSFWGLFATIRKQMLVVIFQIGTIVLNIAGNYALIRAGYGITGAAISTAFCQTLFSLALTVLAFSRFHGSWRLLGKLAQVYGGPLLAVLLVVGSHAALQTTAAPESLAALSVAGLLTLFLYSLFVLFFLRRLGMPFGSLLARLGFGGKSPTTKDEPEPGEKS